MPRKPIDYSNTIIYKLCCNDPSITAVYVGHTTDFVKRKYGHKQTCNNERDKGHNIYVYQFIRDNGGWANWSMVEIEKISCTDSNDACKNERRHIELLGATLNKQVPTRTHKEYNKKYIEEHKEELNEKNKKYYYKHQKEQIEIQKKYYEEHKEEAQEYYKKYYEEHKDEILEKQKKYREDHREEILEKQKLKRKLQKSTVSSGLI